ncbi:FKBP-type peptidyl-prolyl cis-trans isomerase [Sediminibacter sp. Hel_I_10]|uniref:FKBP-type peptidyl-prolyl cis-trans isomerase n=1 Tax=Sediminibacter sp. Hel_I_10 TaxID=1392490 RepID=UPI0012DF8B02|nr:hypothetical protein [Sediminibacter sp. Hel_I_10]
MKLNVVYIFAIVVLSCLSSCKKDDDGDLVFLPPRDRTEQQIADRDSLIGYLETHYYNSSTFDVPGNYSTSDIVLTELPKDDSGNYLSLPDPENNTLLIDSPLLETNTTTFAETEYEYYVLRLNEGGGENPNFSDNIKINYSGILLDGEVFDNTVNADMPLDLVRLIPAWRIVIPSFGTAEGGSTLNEDGTFSYENYGLGVMFIPSGLAYFSEVPYTYTNLIFKFELYDSTVNDHDGDGVLSHLEDINENSNVFDDDSDGDGLPDYVDTDDDGDGVFTLFEDIDGDGDPTNDDTNNNGIPNYLDPESTESNQD